VAVLRLFDCLSVKEITVVTSIPPDLDRIVKIIVEWAEELPLKRVYIFGSRVRGDAAVDSDLDVAIEFEPPPTVNQKMWS